MAQQNEAGVGGGKQPLIDWKLVGMVIALGIILILIGQYASKKIALTLAGLIFLSSLMFNIEKLKEVFA